MVRGKFRVGEVTRYNWNRRAAYVKLESVTPPEGDPDPFAASMSIMITDPATIDDFPLGSEMYVDFTLVNSDT